MKTKILIILIVLICLGVGGFFVLNTGFLQQFNLLRPGTTSMKILPRRQISFVKAMWLFSILEPKLPPMADPERLRQNGVNTLALDIEYRVDVKGERVTYFGKGFEDEEKQVISIIRKYKKEGFAIFLFTQIRYMPKAVELEPQGLSKELQEDRQFFEGFNSFVLHWADIAEKENVEFFAPTNEPDYMMGDQRTKIWAQEILPKVREHFNGKLIYKSASVPSSQVSYFDFSGYDVAGITIVVLSRGEYNEAEYRKMVKELIADLKATARRDGVPEIWVSGFGVWEGIQTSLTEKQKADVYQIVFEEAEGKVTGLVPWENTLFPLKDTLMEQMIREWFTEKIK